MKFILLLSKIEFFAYGLLTMSFFMPIKFNSIAIIVLAVIVGLNLLLKRDFIREVESQIWMLILFFILAIGLIYSQDINNGLNVLGRHSSLLFMPLLVIGSKRFSKEQRMKLMNVYLISAATLGIICLSIAFSKYLTTGSVYIPGKSVFFGYNNFMHQRLTEPAGMHAIYFSFYLSFGNILILNHLINSWKELRWKKLSYIFLFIFFCVLLYLLKSSLFSFAFALSICLLLLFKLKPYFFSNFKRIFFLTIVLSTIGILSYSGIKSKIESFSLEYELSDDHLTPLTMRFAMWECALNLIKEKPFLGYGTGDAQKVLLDEYSRSGFQIGTDKKFNVHNMYLQYALGNGIFSTLVFCLVLFSLFVKSIKNKDLIFITFILLFTIFSITESTMLKHRGIVFFLFFSSLFYQSQHFWNFKPQSQR